MSLAEKKHRKRVKQFVRLGMLWKQLMGKYEVFREYKTLELGVKPKLIEEVHNSPLFLENSVYIIELFLNKYTSSEKYIRNALKYKKRYNLNNEEVCDISKANLDYFNRELATLERSEYLKKNLTPSELKVKPTRKLLTLKGTKDS